MAKIKTVIIGCDHTGCDEQIVRDVDSTWAARRIAKAEGWRRVNKPVRDLCPAHYDDKWDAP